jgi:hypothetical protein
LVLQPGLFAGAWIWKPAWDHLSAIGYSELFAALDTIDATHASIDLLRHMPIGVG